MFLRKFSLDESAVEGLPVRLTVTVILFSVILALSARALYHFVSDENEKKLMGELDMIEKHASIIYMNGGARDMNDLEGFSGTIEKINVHIPDNIAFAVFGGMPTKDGKPPETMDEHSDNVYYYILNDGRVQTRSSVARFSANVTGLNKPLVLYPGEYELTLELVRNNNGTYVRIG